MVLDSIRSGRPQEGAGTLEKARALLDKVGAGGQMPHEEYQAYAQAEAYATAAQMARFTTVPQNALQNICEEVATALARELGEAPTLAELDGKAEAIIRRHMPIIALLTLAGATREDVASIQLRDMLPRVVEGLLDDWKELDFVSRDNARVALDQARQTIRMMEVKDVVEQLARHGLLVHGDKDVTSAQKELKKVHMPQSMEGDDIALRRGTAGFVALLGALLLYKVIEINHAAYMLVRNDPHAKPIEERDDFLSLWDLLKKKYREGAAAAGDDDPARIGLTNVTFEIARGLRYVQDKFLT